MSVNAILAIDDNLGLGYENDLPWPHNKTDMKWFRECTSGHVVVMGRKTWESFGNKPLPNRTNVVISNSKPEGKYDRWFSGSVEMILKTLAEDYEKLDIFVIGGANLYRQALPFCDKLYTTRIKGVYKCDTFMYNDDFKGFDVQEYVEPHDTLTIEIRSRP